MTANTGTIIEFPREKWKTPSQTMEEVYESITNSRKDQIQIMTEMIMEYLTYKVCDEGFDITTDECVNSYILVCEAVEGLMSKSVEIHHPTQDIADELYSEESEEETEAESEEIVEE